MALDGQFSAAHEVLSRYAEASEELPIDRVVAFYGPIPQSFRILCLDTWTEIHNHFRAFLAEMDFHLACAEICTDADPHYWDRKLDLGAEDSRTQLNHCPGVYIENLNTVIVSRFYLPHSIDQRKVGRPYADTAEQNYWLEVPVAFARKAIRHDTGHAINRLMKSVWGIWASETPEFQYAYEADIAALGGREAARAKGYYYVRHHDDHRGRDETFAELWQCSFDQESYGLMPRLWPSTFAYVEEFNSQFQLAWEDYEEAKCARPQDSNRFMPAVWLAAKNQ
jgi:hypothetical protein